VRDAWEAVDTHLRSDQEGEEKTNKVIETITTLDEYHESTLLSHVARRASKAQGIAMLMLTLFGRGLTRPLGFELDPNDEEGAAGSELEREKEKKSTAIIDGYKRLVRKGSVPGHLAICWGVITASLGLALGKFPTHAYAYGL
jgi:urease accessory protein